MPQTGEKPGKGSYMCKGCSYIVSIDDPNNALPSCPRCGKTSYFALQPVNLGSGRHT